MCGTVGRGHVSPELPLSLCGLLLHLDPGDQSPPDTLGSCWPLPPPRAASSQRVWGRRSSPPPQHGLSSSLRMLGTDAFPWKSPRAWVTQTNRVCASQQVSWIHILSVSSEGWSSCRHHRQGRLLVLSAGPAPSFRGRGQHPSVSDPLILKITF